MNAYIYGRYSFHGQKDTSIEQQFKDIHDYCERQDIKIIGEYADRALSGKTDRRPEFQRMMKDCAKGHVKLVICWKVDRFARNRYDAAMYKAKLKKYGVRIDYAKESIPEGPEGILLESILEGSAEYYSANLAQNVDRGMSGNARECKFNGSGLTDGFAIDEKKYYHIDEERAKIVDLVFQLCDDGVKPAEIKRYLADKGIKTVRGKEYTLNGILKMLRNRRYIGEYRWGNIVVPNGIPRIIEDDRFERVQSILESNKKRRGRTAKSQVDFLLTGKLICGCCKAAMSGDSGTGKSGDSYYYYTCHNKKSKKTCSKKSVKKDWIEREVTELTAKHVLREDIIEYIADRIVEIQKKERDDDSMLVYYQQQLIETNTAIHNIMKAIEAGVFTDTTKDRLIELENRKKDLEVEIDQESIALPILSRGQVIFYLNQFKGGDIEDKEYQQQIIDLFVNKVILYDDKVIITYNYSGDRNELTADIIEEAAFEAVAESANDCSDSVSGGSPQHVKQNSRECNILGGFVRIISRITKRTVQARVCPFFLFIL